MLCVLAMLLLSTFLIRYILVSLLLYDWKVLTIINWRERTKGLWTRGSWAKSLTQCGAYDDSHKYSTHCCMEICVLSKVTVSASAHLFQQKISRFNEQDSNKTLMGLAWSLGSVMAACKQPSVVSTFKDAIHP